MNFFLTRKFSCQGYKPPAGQVWSKSFGPFLSFGPSFQTRIFWTLPPKLMELRLWGQAIFCSEEDGRQFWSDKFWSNSASFTSKSASKVGNFCHHLGWNLELNFFEFLWLQQVPLVLRSDKIPKFLKSSQNCVIDGHFCVKIGRNFGPFGGKWQFGVFFTVV